MKATIYSQKGAKTGEIDLPENVFGLPWNSDLVHQVVTSLETNARQSIAHAKTRGEVRGGGKKPWQQKGTGRARHGSIRSPLWVGGGVTHGPRNDKNFARKVNKKAKTKALFAILSRKYKEGEIIFLDKLEFKNPKTKDAKSVFSSIAKIDGIKNLFKNNALLISVPAKNGNAEKSFKNFGNVEVGEVRNINPVSVLNYKYMAIVSPKESFKILESRLPKKNDK